MLRRRLFLEAQNEARRVEALRIKELEEEKQARGGRLKRGLQTVGNVLQKINIGKWIDDLEKDQELADELDRINQENKEEAARLEICRQAEAACFAAMEEHLHSFLAEHPDDGVSYEDWIRDLHPDNVDEETNEIDARFLVPDSDHYRLWKQVHAKKGEGDELVDEDLSDSKAA